MRAQRIRRRCECRFVLRRIGTLDGQGSKAEVGDGTVLGQQEEERGAGGGGTNDAGSKKSRLRKWRGQGIQQ